LIGVRKDFTQLREIREPALSHDRVPTSKRSFGVRVFFRELVQALPRNNMHYESATLSEPFCYEKQRARAEANSFFMVEAVILFFPRQHLRCFGGR
jgi:hypothetical protein